MAAIARRDLVTAIRYGTGFLSTAAGAGAELAAFYYLSRAIVPGFRPQGADYFPLLTGGHRLLYVFGDGDQCVLGHGVGSTADGKPRNPGDNFHPSAGAGIPQRDLGLRREYCATGVLFGGGSTFVWRAVADPEYSWVHRGFCPLAGDSGCARHSDSRVAVGDSEKTRPRCGCWDPEYGS